MKKLLFYLFPLLSIFTFTACVEDLPDLFGDIYGIVYDKETSEPIRGAEVILAPGNKTTVTGFNGQYEFKNLDPRQYELQVTASGYNSNSRQITAIAGESVTCDITMTAIKAVADIELGNNNFNFGSIHTEQTLVITNVGNAGSVNWEITGIDVSWLKASPTSGTIAEGKKASIKLMADHSKLATDEASTTFMVNAAGNSYAVRANINKPTVTGIKGTVKDAESGEAVSSCIVKITPGNGQQSTDQSGTFKFDDLTAGEYTIVFEKNGYQKKTETVTITTGEMKDLDFIIKPLTKFAVSPEAIDFASDKNELLFTLMNNSNSETSFTISDIPEWLTLNPTSGRMDATSERVVVAEVDRKKVANGSYSHKIRISYSGQTQGDILLEVKLTKVQTAADCDVWDGKIAKDFAGGSGAKYDPYIVKTGGQLLLAKNYSSKYFKLENDIDLNNKNWLPIAEFSGTLDGNGKTIYNLRVERDDISCRGLIGELSGTVKNLTVSGVKIKGSNTGVIAGYVDNGTVDNCKVILADGSMLQGTNVGGIAGKVSSVSYIENCTVESTNNSVAINGSYVGGIAGYTNSNGSIKNCRVNSNIAGESRVGGICGFGYVTINSCEYNGNISGTQYIGGISGEGGSIIACKAMANIEGDNYIGGLLGGGYRQTIIASYSNGEITAAASASRIGGISAQYSLANLCYSTTICNHSKFVPIDNSNNCYSVYDTANIAEKMEEAYSDYADYWDFNNVWIWKGTINREEKQVICPRLAWEK